MSDTLVLDQPETAAAETTTPATTSDSNPKWDAERKKHGPINAGQLIGHMGADATYHGSEQRPDGSYSKPRISGRFAVSRGKDFDSSWFSFNIYAGTISGDESTRPSEAQLQELASQLTKSTRVKMQGALEFLQTSTDNYNAACAAAGVQPGSEESKQIPWLRNMFFSGTSRMTLFVTTNDIPAPLDAEGLRPVTILPSVGDDVRSDSRLPY